MAGIDGALEGAQGAVGVIAAGRHGDADARGVAERAAGRDDQPGPLEAAGELRAVEPRRGDPEDVGLAPATS